MVETVERKVRALKRNRGVAESDNLNLEERRVFLIKGGSIRSSQKELFCLLLLVYTQSSSPMVWALEGWCQRDRVIQVLWFRQVWREWMLSSEQRGRVGCCSFLLASLYQQHFSGNWTFSSPQLPRGWPSLHPVSHILSRICRNISLPYLFS